MLVALLIVAAAALAEAVALFAVVRSSAGSAGRDEKRLAALEAAQREASERLARAVRDEFAQSRKEASEAARAGREELRAALAEQGRAQREAGELQASALRETLEGLSRGLTGTLSEHRREQTGAIERLTTANEARLNALRETVERQLTALQEHNTQKLEEMRRTVDEKLHATLEQRLGESFRIVSERLEKVYQGLGEMQQLAGGVDDLKRIMTNVKARGTWGEVQLGALLEQMLAPEQYAASVAVRPGAGERVDFAIRLPGRLVGDVPVWLPIDAKFPLEDYQRLAAAQDAVDPAVVEEAGRALERRVREEALSIRAKYVAPPHTTDFALLFVPTEGLYAELIRRPGLLEHLQREARVILTGPTTLTAILNSLQMGFRTLAIERRSSEVWETLGAVKTEFSKFGSVLDRVRKKIEQAGNEFDEVGRRTRAINRKLRDVQTLPEERSAELLGADLQDLDVTEEDAG